MKKQIDLHDLSQISDLARKEYRNWWRSKEPTKYSRIEDMDYEDMPLMTIGDMIEFIREEEPLRTWTYCLLSSAHSMTMDVCDLLWEETTRILNELSKE